MAQLQRFAGGGFGLGGTLAARQFFDEAGQSRFMQPSVMFGLGTGALASALYLTDIETPFIGDDFWASHAITSVPAGAFFLAFPKKANQSTVEQVRSALGNGMSSGTTSTQRASANRVTVTQQGHTTGASSGMGRQR